MRTHAPRFLGYCAALVTALCCSTLRAQADPPPESAFLPLDIPGAALQSGSAPGARPVAINPRLRNLALTRLNVAPGLDLDAERIRLESRPGGDFVWVGRLKGEPLSQVTIASRGGIVSGHLNRPVVDGNVLYTIRPTPAGVSVLQEEQAPEIPEHDDTLPALNARTSRLQAGPVRKAALAASYPAATAANPAVVDVLVVYTPATTARYGGAAAVEALALEAVASANTAYQNSGVHITLNLLHAAEVAYSETYNMNDALSRLANPADGFMDDVHAMRETYGADLVVLFDQDTNYCGLAYQMSTVDTSFSGSAFSVVYTSCIATYSMTHEMAHNMGSHHDRDNAFTSAAYPYSYGHKICTTDGTGYRTVMSYACYGATVPRVNYFSNPEITFNGVPTGVPSTDFFYAADNAKSLNNTAHTVAAFRTRVVPPPSAPTTLAAAAMGSTAISLAWTDTATSEDSYQIERSPDTATWTQVASVAADATAYCDNTVSPATTATFRVRACNGNGCSEWSNLATATTPPPELGTPTGLTATASGPFSVSLSWTDTTTGETSIEVQRSADAANWLTFATLAADSTACTDATVTAGATFHYRVRAISATGCSEFSTVASATTPEAPPAPPTGLTGTAASSTRVNLAWTDNASVETGFRVERSANGSSFSLIATVSANITSYADTSVTGGQTWYYRVIATGVSANSAASSTVVVTTPVPTPPTAPNTLKATAQSTSSIRLTWLDRSNNETGFEIQRSADNGVTFTTVKLTSANAVSYTDTGLTTRKTYKYRIRAVATGTASAWTAVVSATTK